MKNLVQKILLSTFLFSSTLIPNASAEIIHVEADGSILQADIETQSQAQQRALSTAMRNAAMSAGSRIYSLQRSSDNIMEEDEIQLSTVSFIHLSDEPEFEYEADKAFNSKMPVMIVHCHVSATVDSDEVEKLLHSDNSSEMIRRNQKYIDDGNRIGTEYETAIKNYVATDDESERDRIADELKKNQDEFLANEHLGTANRYYQEEKYLDAIDEYNLALELNPNLAEAYNNRGVTYDTLGNLDAALRDYNRAIESTDNPDEISMAYNNIGFIYAEKNNLEMAMRQFDKSIEIYPDRFEAYDNRGYVNIALKNYNQALKDLSKAIELNPKLAEAYNGRASIYTIFEQYEEAIQDYNSAIALKPDYAEAYSERGWIYYMLDRYDEAMQDYNRAIELNPDYANAYNNRGLLYNDLGYSSRAREDFLRAIELEPDNEVFRENLKLTR